MSYYDCEETDYAVDCYARKYGPDADMPNRCETGIEGDRVVLRTGGRVLAAYDLDSVRKAIERREDRRIG